MVSSTDKQQFSIETDLDKIHKIIYDASLELRQRPNMFSQNHYLESQFRCRKYG